VVLPGTPLDILYLHGPAGAREDLRQLPGGSDTAKWVGKQTRESGGMGSGEGQNESPA
jgi:hypothetical protein